MIDAQQQLLIQPGYPAIPLAIAFKEQVLGNVSAEVSEDPLLLKEFPSTHSAVGTVATGTPSRSQ